MADVGIVAAGAVGTHALTRTNFNVEDDSFYYNSTAGESIPTALSDGAPWIYRTTTGSITGLTSGNLYFTRVIDKYTLKFSTTYNGSAVDLTAYTAGNFTLNYPYVYNNLLNLDALYNDQQAVKYYTAGTPITGLTSGTTYFLKTSGSGFSQTPLYSFSSPFTFGNASTTGPNGPTLGSLQTAYSGTAWATGGTYLKQGNFQGYQDWVVPQTGIYEFTVRGAGGNTGGSTGSFTAGRGAVVKGQVRLVKGETITVTVGQLGVNGSNPSWPASGGGTFVVRKSNNTPLLVAAGGTAAGAQSGNGIDGRLSTSGGTGTLARSGGTNGAGGSAGAAAGAGGGFTSAGGTSTYGGTAGLGFNGGLVGGTGNAGSNGGFGGAGGSEGQTVGASAASGGYSGGGGTDATNGARGGAGGSFISSLVSNAATSDGTYESSQTFNGNAITNLSSWNSAGGSVVVSLVSSTLSAYTIHSTPVAAAAGTGAISLTPAGTQYHAITPITVDLASNIIYTTSAHGISNGESLTYRFTGTAVTPLLSNTVYYANVVDAYSYKISTTPSSSFTDVDFTIPSNSTAESFGKVIVNTSTDTITINSHGFLANQPVKYQTNGGTAIAPLQDGATYYVKTVVDANNIKLSQSLGGTAIDLTSAGTGTGHSFIYVVVNLTEESLYIPGHELVTGSKVIYSAGAGTPIGGLTSGGTYYAYKVDANIIRLSTTKDGASIINLTSLGTGNHTLTTNSVDTTTETISIPSHGFSQGELVQYDSVGQTPIGGLSSGNPYYIILVDGDNIRLATTLENSNAGTAINLTSTGVGRHRILSLSKSPDGTYIISTTPTSTTFTVAANGYVPLIVKEFTPRQEIDLQANNLRILDHGFITGTKVTYSNNSGTSIGGLTTATDYYVIGINKDYIRLATTAENASSGVPVVFTSFGAGIDHKLTASQINGFKTGTGTVSTAAGSTLVSGVNTQFSKILKVGDRFRLFPPDTVTTSTFAAANIALNTVNTITINGHLFNTADCIKYNNGGGGTPTGLTNNQMYFVRRIDGNTVKLYNTSADSVANTNPVVITTIGSGSAHTIKKTVPVQPIVRRISAIGSDTQITVDRPYTASYSGIYYSYQTFIYVRPQGYSLHRPFDGGVEMSTGAGTSWSQIIRQTRKYFRYQSGKGLQTSFGINFKPTIDLETLVRVSSTTFQGTTRRPHGLINGLYIKISQATTSTGATSAVYNGTFQVTVLDTLNFTCIATTTVPSGTESKAYGFPQFNVTSWNNGAIRAGMFDFQNGMFFEFDGQKIYAVRRSSTQQISGTVSALQGSEFVFGTGTSFTTQLKVNDFIVLRGQSYKVSSVISNTRITIKPEYKGASGTDKEFVPGDGATGVVRTSTGSFVIQNHGFVDNLPIVYNSIDGTPIGGLINGRTYYVSLTDNNNFKLKAAPDSGTTVTLSDAGTGTPHSFTPAKSGIIGTLTVDTRTPQENWSIDPCDGTGPTGYNLDLDKIQMGYMDYSWYGAGKIRYGFKGTEGEVVYVHEYIHNNFQLESYFRSGNLPTRYEVVTYDSPTYIPFLFHWGTSVIMDGKFDDDKAYLFTQNSQTLTVTGTTPKSYGSTATNITTNQINIPTHGFATGNAITFIGLTSGGVAGSNTQNPTITAQASLYNFTNIQNNSTLYTRAVDVNNVTLHPTQADATAGTNTIDFTSQGNAQYTYYLYPIGSYNNTSGPNYQPLLSIRLSPSVSSGLTGKLGDRDVINRMQLRMQEIAVQTTQLVDVKVLINPRLNNLNFSGVASPSLTQIIQHTSNDTVSGGTQIYNFRAAGQNGVEQSTTVDISDLFELSNSILGGDSVFPDGPDILTIAVSRLTGSTTLTSAKLTWTEAQA